MINICKKYEMFMIQTLMVMMAQTFSRLSVNDEKS